MKYLDHNDDSDEHLACVATLEAQSERATSIHPAAAQYVPATYTKGAFGWSVPYEKRPHPDHGKPGANQRRVLLVIEDKAQASVSQRTLPVPARGRNVVVRRVLDTMPPEFAPVDNAPGIQAAKGED